MSRYRDVEIHAEKSYSFTVKGIGYDVKSPHFQVLHHLMQPPALTITSIFINNSYALCRPMPIGKSSHCLYLLFDACINIDRNPGLNPQRQL
ncbi:MAG: hypothetical protein HRT95_05810 [Moritella sp.]|uniref:hypothetical protein n=1 Tax=Moritella sp. TaxID=78556 RepID=UPI001D99C5B3|nr:hypothetical protein [Moritella sp.]NQZ49707.1 hypothetical protein [Moritella sp.]